MYRVILSPESKRDLSGILLSIAEAGFPGNARAFTERIVSFCESLAAFPHRGTSHADLARGLRSVGYRKQARIVFFVSDQEQTLTVLRILSRRQSLERALRGLK